MNGKKGITDLIRGDATCPYMKNIPDLKKNFEVFKKDGSVYNPQNHPFAIPKRSVSVLIHFPKTKRLFLDKN